MPPHPPAAQLPRGLPLQARSGHHPVTGLAQARPVDPVRPAGISSTDEEHAAAGQEPKQEDTSRLQDPDRGLHRSPPFRSFRSDSEREQRNSRANATPRTEAQGFETLGLLSPRQAAAVYEFNGRSRPRGRSGAQASGFPGDRAICGRSRQVVRSSTARSRLRRLSGLAPRERRDGAAGGAFLGQEGCHLFAGRR